MKVRLVIQLGVMLHPTQFHIKTTGIKITTKLRDYQPSESLKETKITEIKTKGDLILGIIATLTMLLIEEVIDTQLKSIEITIVFPATRAVTQRKVAMIIVAPIVVTETTETETVIVIEVLVTTTIVIIETEKNLAKFDAIRNQINLKPPVSKVVLLIKVFVFYFTFF